jgi:NADPH:quinone reductase-like Zn-dependent oxidoreductase
VRFVLWFSIRQLSFKYHHVNTTIKHTMEQKALLLKEKYGPFALETRPIPKPGPGGLLVKVLAVGLNPIDWKIQTIGYVVENYPTVLGSDIAGDVEALGEGVEPAKWPKGTRVWVACCGCCWFNDWISHLS